jgi:peptidoglycan/xylan/chitin deacetylase (PgdA/CDA1 family)
MSVLCYHAVDPCWSSPLAVTPEDFEVQLAWLARTRDVVPLAVALDHMDQRGRLPRGMVALTFDDGFAQLEEHVFPALARHRLPATVFLVAATLTPEGQPVDWVDTPPEWPLETLTVDQVLAAAEQGVDLQSHTWSHPRLTDLDADACRAEMSRSRELLSDLLHRSVDHVAYPRGLHDEQARRAAQDAGYTHGFALPESREEPGPYAVPRVGVWPGNGRPALRVKTMPEYLPVRHSPVFPALRSVARRVRP